VVYGLKRRAGVGKRGMAVLRKIIFLSATAALVAAGFVGGSMAAIGGGHECPPGSPCAPPTGTDTGTTSTTIVRGPKPTLKVSASALDFGTTLHVTGSVPGAPAGQVVEILSQTCGFTQVLLIATTKTRADGSYAFAIQPMQNVVFYARSGNSPSAPQPVTIRPKIELARGVGRNFVVKVSAGNGAFFSSVVAIERYDKVRRTWRSVATGKLHAASDPGEIISVSSATIPTKVASGTKLRATASQAAVGQCFRATKSQPITG
jgi:hypothetical protein